MLNSPPSVIIDRDSISARKIEYTFGNLMHLFIESLIESQTSLNKRAVQPLACLRVFGRQDPTETMRDAFR